MGSSEWFKALRREDRKIVLSLLHELRHYMDENPGNYARGSYELIEALLLGLEADHEDAKKTDRTP